VVGAAIERVRLGTKEAIDTAENAEAAIASGVWLFP